MKRLRAGISTTFTIVAIDSAARVVTLNNPTTGSI
jgi:hypothetical protein